MTDNIAIAFKDIKMDSGHERNSLRAVSLSNPFSNWFAATLQHLAATNI